MKPKRSLSAHNAQINQIYSYYGSPLKNDQWEVTALNPNGSYDLKRPFDGMESKGYPGDMGLFTLEQDIPNTEQFLGWIGIDENGDPVRPVKSSAYFASPNKQKLPPRIYTTPQRAKQYHGAVDAREVFMK